jgi:translocation and assembly module TamB
MASVSQRRVRRQGSFESQRQASYRPKKRRWLKRIVLLFTLLVIIALLLPTIIAKTALRNAPLRLALANLRGTVEAGGASLSWLGPIQYTDLEIRDPHGELILALPKVESEKSLLAIVQNLNDLGTFHVERPQISIVVRADGSNVEDVMPRAAATSSSPAPAASGGATKLPAIAIEIVDGSIKLADAATGQQCLVDKLNLKVRTSVDSFVPAELTLSAKVATSQASAPRTAPPQSPVSGTVNAAVKTAESGSRQLDLKIENVPLVVARPLANHFAPGLQLAGNLSSNLECDGLGGAATSKLQVSGTVNLDDLAAAGGPLGNDRLALRHLEVPCKLSYQNRQFDIEQLALNSDLGQLSMNGSIALGEQAGAAAAQVARSAFNLQGQLDLARLAALMPNTLHVRSGTQVTSGQLELAIGNQSDAGGRSWTGQLVASNLTAVHDGRQISWDQPINLQLAAHEQGGNYALDQLNCTSSFLTLSGRGSLDQFHAEAQCDLNQLMAELNQFVDLGQLRLSGRGSARFDWQHTTFGAFQTSAEARLQGLEIALPGKPAWNEEQFTASASASGSIDNLALSSLGSAKLKRIDAAQLAASVDNPTTQTHEQVEVRLLAPIDGLSGNSTSSGKVVPSGASTGVAWPVEAHLQGQLARWWPRIASWLGVSEVELGGACDLTAQATCSNAGVDVQQIRGAINGLHAWGWNELFIDEPEVRLEGSGRYEFTPGRLSLNRTLIQTQTLSMQTDSASITLGGGKPIVQGNLVYQADMNRLARWTNDPRTVPDYALAGHLVGNLDVVREGAATTCKSTTTIDNFVVYALDDEVKNPRAGSRNNPVRSAEAVWQEPQLTLTAAGRLDTAADTLQLASLDLGSRALALHAAGRIDALTTQQNLNLAGKLDYDWNSLAPLLKPIFGKRVAIVGRESRNFSVRGPLNAGSSNPPAAGSIVKASYNQASPSDTLASDKFACLRALVGDVSFGWSQANLYGLGIGQLDLEAHLENGTLALKPIETTIGDRRTPGTLTVSPLVHLSPGPAELVLGKGPLLTNVPVTDELADAWMKFVTPILAEATRTDGLVSVQLDGGRVPLSDPNRADIGGKLIVKDLQVTPGPLFRPFALIGKQVEAIIKGRVVPNDLGRDPALLKIDDQKVDFHVVDGRVYHQGLSMKTGDVTIRTRGWVGLDETVNIVAEIPVKPEWAAQHNSPLAGLGEDVIRIPIQGNLKDPKFDNRVMAKLIETLPRAAIENAINKGLDRLFSPPEH